MNKIEFVYLKSKYSANKHLVITIDNKQLDEIIDSIKPNSDLLGLVPSISWLDNPTESNFALDSLTSDSIAPILVCPDDQDLSCSVIVVDVEINFEIVTWKRVGLNLPHSSNSAKFGSRVEWFPMVGSFSFSKSEYLNCLRKLQNENL